MYPTVYYHHTSRIAQLMFLNALEHFITSEAEVESSSSLREDELLQRVKKMDDYEINIALRDAKGYPREMMERINNRRLFKRAIYTTANKLEKSVVEELSDERRVREVEEEISSKAGIDERYVILDVQKGESLKEGEAKVLVDDDLTLRSLRDVSSLVRMLGKDFQENYKIGVYTIEKYSSDVKSAAEEILCR